MADVFIIGDSIIIGGIIGLYEAIVIHRDVKVASHRFMHTLHAMGLSIGFTFGTLNSTLILKLTPELSQIPFLTPLVFQIAIGVIAAIKIHLISKSGKHGSFSSSETWFHSILIGALIAAVPYVYPFIKHLIPRFI